MIYRSIWVEAIIQMPSDGFFNTGIFTYLWVLNKNRPKEQKDQVLLINGSNGWQQLKKNRGSKRREMLLEHRTAIVNALLNYKSSDIAKLFDKWHFYYNKQPLTLINIDDKGRSVLDTIVKEEKAYSLKLDKICWNEEDVKPSVENLKLLKGLDIKEENLQLIEKDGTYYRFDKDLNTIIKTQNERDEQLGCGTFIFKLTKSKKDGGLLFSAAIDAEYIQDYEIIPYNSDPVQNKANIQAFMDKYIIKPYFIKEEPTVGVELNFNKEFYVPEKIEKVDDILAELQDMEKELKILERGLGL